MNLPHTRFRMADCAFRAALASIGSSVVFPSLLRFIWAHLSFKRPRPGRGARCARIPAPTGGPLCPVTCGPVSARSVRLYRLVYGPNSSGLVFSRRGQTARSTRARFFASASRASPAMRSSDRTTRYTELESVT